jgi:hypothetical protein
MYSFKYLAAFCLRRVLPRLVAMLWMVSPGLSWADTNAPAISTQPGNGIAGLGEDFVFRVEAAGAAPLKYQWFLNSSPLGGQTGAALWLTNLTANYSGIYWVTVANSAGTVTSSNAVLVVQETLVTRRLETGRLLKSGAQVGVPIVMRANGRENFVAFSLTYNTNTYSSPVFLSAFTNAVTTVDTSRAGAIGISLALPAGEMLPSGYPWLGLLRFDLASDNGLFQGELAFATNPVPLLARNTNGLSLSLFATVQPQYQLTASQPGLQPQSGLFEHKLRISNPGAQIISNLDILAFDLGMDTLGNSNLFYNAHTTLTNYPYGDPLLEVAADCSQGWYLGDTNEYAFSDYLLCGSDPAGLDDTYTNHVLSLAQIYNVLPGESRLATIEYFVTDHVTAPQPKYILYQDAPITVTIPGNIAAVPIVTNRYVNQTFLVEFPTYAGWKYYIQYSETLDGLVTNVHTVLPPIPGTGNRLQWIDNGPPKTATAPADGSRFYRVMKY